MNRFAAAWIALLLALTGFAPHAAQAQEASLTPDRPGIGDGSAVMAPGQFQVETGYRFVDGSGVDQHDIGELLLRYGVVPGLELRAALNSFVAQIGAGSADDESGLSDAGVGLKLSLVRGDGRPMGRPNLSLVASTTLPTGSDAFSSDVAQPTVKVAYDWPLSNAVAFSANAGYTFDTGDAVDGAVDVTATLGAGLPAAPGLGVYAGYAGSFTTGPDVSFVEGGLTYLLHPNTQLDLNGAVGVSDAVDDFFIGAGLAHRF